jgi:hypothetical protein
MITALKGIMAALAFCAIFGLAVAQTACQNTAASCARPALITAHGSHGSQSYYSSYRTSGTMPSGETVRLSDGDLWTCANGVVTVH